MKESHETVTIKNKLGMHARAAAMFVKAADHFASEIFVIRGSKRVNGKSIMGLLMLAAGQGTKITIEARGADSETAIKKLSALVHRGFYEN